MPATRPLFVGLALLFATLPLAAQRASADSSRAEPDSATVAAGKALFEGRALCASCHGLHGEGMLGPTTQLNAGKPKWLHHDGSLAGIISVITHGVDADHSESGQVMPPRGGARLTDAQIRQVAAYVRQLHTQAPPPPP
jgi:mono/diheme cytochrome c family protein